MRVDESRQHGGGRQVNRASAYGVSCEGSSIPDFLNTVAFNQYGLIDQNAPATRVKEVAGFNQDDRLRCCLGPGQAAEAENCCDEVSSEQVLISWENEEQIPRYARKRQFY